MTIVQIAKIQHRKGLQENLPQLASAELGFAIDTQKLYIGRGKPSEGSPIIGNLEILTENSDILNIAGTYTYEGNNAGYKVNTGGTGNLPITRSLQDKLDEYVSVLDFGAVGDGQNDDGPAINHAISELFNREITPQSRRKLYFPAGIYLTSETILIPPYAVIEGDGPDSTIILYTSHGTAMRTCDSNRNITNNIALNGDYPPSNNIIANLTLQTRFFADLLHLDQCEFFSAHNVKFTGILKEKDFDIQNPDMVKYGIKLTGTPIRPTKYVMFDNCHVSGIYYGLYANENATAVSFNNGSFNVHYKGIYLGEDNTEYSPTNIRIAGNHFDHVYSHGIEFRWANSNVSAYNYFADVGNRIYGIQNPMYPNIEMLGNNLSIGDVFERPTNQHDIIPRINLNNTRSIAYSTDTLQLGKYEKDSTTTLTLPNNTFIPRELFRIDVTQFNAFEIEYTIKRNCYVRKGKMNATIGFNQRGTVFEDEYTEVDDIGVEFNVEQENNFIKVMYITTNLGPTAEMVFTINRFRD